MRTEKRRPVILAAVSFMLALSLVSAFADGFGTELILSGKYELPVSVCISSPQYKQIAQFGKERTEYMNSLIKHIGITVTTDGDISETALTVDSEPVFTYISWETDSVQHTVYSFEPETVYERKNTEGEDYPFLQFLEQEFFILNRLLDDLYPVFEKSAEVFRDFGKPSAANLNFRGYGKGVRKLTIPLSDQYVKEHFPGILTELAVTDESRAFLGKLIFSGPQKIILLYDQDDRLLRINYDGAVGLSEDSIRRVSLVWRCLRSGDQKKDNLTLKTPALKGYDKYNISYERLVDLSDDSVHSVSWNLQIDLKSDQVRKKISFTAELNTTDSQIEGDTVYSEKQGGTEKRIVIVPSLRKENDADYSGTIEITNYSGKIVISSIQAGIKIYKGEKLAAPANPTAGMSDELNPDDTERENEVQERMNSLLIRRLLKLPAEDLLFFSLDIPEDAWNSIVQSIF